MSFRVIDASWVQSETMLSAYLSGLSEGGSVFEGQQGLQCLSQKISDSWGLCQILNVIIIELT